MKEIRAQEAAEEISSLLVNDQKSARTLDQLTALESSIKLGKVLFCADGMEESDVQRIYTMILAVARSKGLKIENAYIPPHQFDHEGETVSNRRLNKFYVEFSLAVTTATEPGTVHCCERS